MQESTSFGADRDDANHTKIQNFGHRIDDSDMSWLEDGDPPLQDDPQEQNSPEESEESDSSDSVTSVDVNGLQDMKPKQMIRIFKKTARGMKALKVNAKKRIKRYEAYKKKSKKQLLEAKLKCKKKVFNKSKLVLTKQMKTSKE